MIAIWMVYAIGVSALVLAAAWLFDHGLRGLRLPLRHLWLGALIAALLVSIATLLAFVSTRATTEAPRTPFATDAGVLGSVAPAGRDRQSAQVPGPQTQPSQDTRAAGSNLLALRSPLPVKETALPRWLDVLLVLAWVGGSLGFLAVIVRSIRRFRGGRRDWRLEYIEGVPVFVSHDIGPALCGILEYRIVIPQWVLELSTAARRLVLQHEREHARVADPVLVLCAAAGPVLMPWNPVMWYMLRRLRRAVELDCDRRVLRLHPDPRTYGEVLLEVTERSVPQSLQFAALSQPAAILADRIDAIASHRRFSPGRIAFDVTAGIAALLLVAAAPRPRLVASDQSHLDRITAEVGTLVRAASGDGEMPLVDRIRLLRRFERQLAPEAGLLMHPTRAELQEMVGTLYPSLLSDTAEQSVVGLLLDLDFQVLRHTSQTVATDRFEAPGSLYWLFPDILPGSIEWSGVAFVSAGNRKDGVGVVYGIRK